MDFSRQKERLARQKEADFGLVARVEQSIVDCEFFLANETPAADVLHWIVLQLRLLRRREGNVEKARRQYVLEMERAIGAISPDGLTPTPLPPPGVIREAARRKVESVGEILGRSLRQMRPMLDTMPMQTVACTLLQAMQIIVAPLVQDEKLSVSATGLKDGSWRHAVVREEVLQTPQLFEMREAHPEAVYDILGFEMRGRLLYNELRRIPLQQQSLVS